jgi:dipeptidase D
MNLEDLIKDDIFKYFNEISNIPRCSHKENRIADYLEQFAKARKLAYIRDQENNLIIKRNIEGNQSVALQAHIDMVCIKTEGTSHDFSKDPLNLQLTNNLLSAKNTTLGADNGIGVAYMLALLADDYYKGPNLECIFTTNEEDGMSGASMLDLTSLNSKFLLNLDSEEEGKLYVSCAGGIVCNFHIPIKYKLRQGFTYNIKISGLKGGHSGLEIDKKRGNAIKQAARILNYLQEESIAFRLVEINGGKKHNAIPEETTIKILLKNTDQLEDLKALINNCQNIFQKELRNNDPDVKVTLTYINNEQINTFSKGTTITLIGLLNLLPNGVIKMSDEIPLLVETSANIGKVIQENDFIKITTSLRSSKDENIDTLLEMFDQLKTAFNLQFTTEYSYPGWNYDKNSLLKEIAKETYNNLFNQKLEEIAIHAGLECGFFRNKKADLDIISFGPNIYNIHTPDESVDIISVKKVYNFLKAILKKLG